MMKNIAKKVNSEHLKTCIYALGLMIELRFLRVLRAENAVQRGKSRTIDDPNRDSYAFKRPELTS